MTATGFEQSEVDPFALRSVVNVEATMVVAVHVDHVLARAKEKAGMDRFTAGLGASSI